MEPRLAEMGTDEFVTYLGIGIFTESEIVEKIRSYGRLASSKDVLAISQAVLAMPPPGQPPSLPIRNALRSLYDLPPLTE